ncbi:hypothetical protein ACQKWADRAFT_109680 [Trichoderma austrokoningii]
MASFQLVCASLVPATTLLSVIRREYGNIRISRWTQSLIPTDETSPRAHSKDTNSAFAFSGLAADLVLLAVVFAYHVQVRAPSARASGFQATVSEEALQQHQGRPWQLRDIRGLSLTCCIGDSRFRLGDLGDWSLQTACQLLAILHRGR